MGRVGRRRRVGSDQSRDSITGDRTRKCLETTRFTKTRTRKDSFKSIAAPPAALPMPIVIPVQKSFYEKHRPLVWLILGILSLILLTLGYLWMTGYFKKPDPVIPR